MYGGAWLITIGVARRLRLKRGLVADDPRKVVLGLGREGLDCGNGLGPETEEG